MPDNIVITMIPQKILVSLQAQDNSFEKSYEVTTEGKTSESYLKDLGDILKTAQQETNQKLTEIVQAKASSQTKKIEKESSEDREPITKRVKNNSQ